MADDWTVPDAASVIDVSLVPPPSFPSSKTTETFHPTYTHQFFINETIYGYKKLHIDLQFRQDDLSPSLQVTYEDKLAVPSGSSGAAAGDNDEATIDDVEDVFKDYLPEDTPEHLSLDPSTFTPPGTLVHSYPRTTSTFEIYHTNFSNPAARSLITNSRLLVPLFIEAGSRIDFDEEDDEEELGNNWDVFFLYEHLPENNQFSFIGYCTIHKYWYFAPKSNTDEKEDWYFAQKSDTDEKKYSHLNRARISQFLILPPYQGKEHGQKLYNIILKEYLNNPKIVEIVVEDPSDKFEKLRDLCDYRRLKRLSLINEDVMNRLLDRKTAREWIDLERTKAKMPLRQFQRVVELLLLEYILIQKGPLYEKRLERYMLYVKERLYRHNKDVLMQLEPEERSEKLAETYERVHTDYEAYLEILESDALAREKPDKGKRVVAGKRLLGTFSTVQEDEEDEEELMPPTKKAKATK
ncbi:histone acetyltransferase 1 [Orbilia blumenaviensis]|uniref:Histone acetyltransferase type B catalytic subunit n=1 Tax=Orbilia blumenaviensis TaxID=1796055 RepID=A0AAV9VB94_9PEZI